MDYRKLCLKQQTGLRGCFERFLGFLGTGDLRVDGRVAGQADLNWLASVIW